MQQRRTALVLIHTSRVAMQLGRGAAWCNRRRFKELGEKGKKWGKREKRVKREKERGEKEKKRKKKKMKQRQLL